jgi:pilus assembly protein Flp/PilA
MQSIASQVRRFLASDDGPTAVEYAVMLGLVVLACIASIGLLGSKTSSLLTDASRKLQ